jgi:hypothetical protein
MHYSDCNRTYRKEKNPARLGAELKDQNQNLTKTLSQQKLLRNVFIAIAVGFALFVVWDQSQKSKKKDD